MMNYKVILFVYDFPHRKSEDFIHIAKAVNINVVGCIGAPKKKLKLPKKVYHRTIPKKEIFHPGKLCEIYGYRYIQADHNSKEAVEFLKEVRGNLGIIAGARILKKHIIDLFEYGIINFHPGKIPEASGLFALYWSIIKGIEPYVTAHFIDERVDAGKIISEREILLDLYDRIEDVEYRIYLSQLSEFENLARNFILKNKPIPSKLVENYTSQNPPMTEDLQWKAIGMFEHWKKRIILNTKEIPDF